MPDPLLDIMEEHEWFAIEEAAIWAVQGEHEAADDWRDDAGYIEVPEPLVTPEDDRKRPYDHEVDGL